MKIKNGTVGAYHSGINLIVVPVDLDFYLKVNPVAGKAIKTSKGWKPVGWEYFGNSRPFLPVTKVSQ